MSTYNQDMLGALYLIAALCPVREVTESYGHYIVLFDGTTANLCLDKRQVSREEIDECIKEAQSHA